MKFVIILACGRSGATLLQSLFDKHSEISQLPGHFFFDEFWSKIIKKNQMGNIADQFTLDYERFFDSRLNVMERHHMLGEGRNGYYLVDKKAFKDLAW